MNIARVCVYMFVLLVLRQMTARQWVCVSLIKQPKQKEREELFR